MNKRLIKVFTFLMLLIIPFGFVNAEEENDIATPEVIEENKYVEVSKDEYYQHSYFEAGNEVTVKKFVDGISFVAGNIVKFDGRTNYGFFAGENVVVSNEVENDLFAAGNEVTLDKNAMIGRDIYLAGSEVRISTSLYGDAYIAASKIVLENIEIYGNVNIAAETLEIKDNVTINGTLKVNDDIKIENQDKLKYTKKEEYSTPKIDFKTQLTSIVLDVLTLIFTGIILSLVFPKLYTKSDNEFNVSKVAKYSLYGFIGLIAVPIMSVVLMGTIVGITAGIVLLLAYVITLLIGMTLSSYALGKAVYTKLFKQNDNLYLSIIIGILLFKLLGYVPYIGGLIVFIGFIYGLGLIINLFLRRNDTK